MKGREHLIFGAVTGGVIALTICENNMGAFFGLSCLGALLPDIDLPESTLGRLRIIHPLSKFLFKNIGHRTYTHDIGYLSVLAVVTTLLNPLWLGLWVGIFGHLFLDALTVKGIPCFNRTIHLLPKMLRFKADSLMATVVTLLLSAGFPYGLDFIVSLL